MSRDNDRLRALDYALRYGHGPVRHPAHAMDWESDVPSEAGGVALRLCAFGYPMELGGRAMSWRRRLEFERADHPDMVVRRYARHGVEAEGWGLYPDVSGVVDHLLDAPLLDEIAIAGGPA